MFESDIIALH